MATVVIPLTAGSTWAVPSNWNSANNTIECIGAGGNGSNAATVAGAGGGGGAYALENNVTLTPGSTVNIQIGTAGGGPGSTGDTYLKDNSSTTVVLARGGSNASAGSGGAGGDTTNSIGDTKYAGGDGGGSGESLYGGGGGGGAGGYYGAGKAGAGSNGGPSLPGELVRWTVTNNTAGAMTNVPIEVPIQFSPSGGLHTMESSACIEVVDNDGTTVIPVQEWGRYSDLNGPDIRGIHKLVCILPNLGASQARELTIKKVASTSPTTGTDITAANITAIMTTCPVVMDHSNGTTYTADIATGLAASTWTNKTTACNKGTWISGGGLATSYVVTVPFKNGGTAAPNNLTLWAEVTAYKSGRGAVSGGNPIIGIKVQYWVKSAYAQETSQVNHWYDLTATCGSNSQAWVGANPSTALTLTAWVDPIYGPQPINAPLVQSTFTASGSSFTANSVGMMISDGVGQAVITEYISATVVYARVTTAFASTSVSSGTWRTWALNQPFSADIPKQEIWYGGSPAITAQPNIDSSLGVAWSGSAGGPFTYMRDCGLILPYTTLYSSITNSMARLNLGNNPCAVAEGYIGDWTAYMPTTGGRDDIAPIPGQYVGPLIRWDTNAKPKIMGNAVKAGMFPMFYIDENTGKCPAFNSATDWFLSNDNWTGTRLPQANFYITGSVREITGATFQVAHHPGLQTVPILLTGDFYHVEQLHEQVFACFTSCNPGYWGSGLNRMFCNASELRGNGWTYRDMCAAILFVPDAGNACLSYDRSSLTTILGNQFTATNSGTPGTPIYPGNNIGLVNNTGPGDTYAVSGYRGMGQGPTNTDLSQWQLGYGLFAHSLGKLMGMVTGDYAAFVTWLMEGLTGAATSSDVNRSWFIPIYYGRAVTNTGTAVSSWLDIYRWSGFDMYNGSAKRLVTGTGITLSGLSGTGITVTMPAGYYTTGGNNYIGCPVVDLNAASFQIDPFTVGTDAFNPRGYRQGVDVVSGSRAFPTNSGSVRVWNTSANPVYVKGSVGAGTATTSDTLVAAGTSVVLDATTNTYLNFISTGGYGDMTVFGSVGTGYAVSDTINPTTGDIAGNFTTNTAAQLTVTEVGPNGDVIEAHFTQPGVYTANTAGSGNGDTVLTQLSTSGGGSGFTYRIQVADQVVLGQGPLRFGVGIVTGVSGNVLTIATNSSWREGAIKCYPFAQTNLVTNKIQTGAPMVGDTNGLSTLADPYLPSPYTGSNDYWQIAINTAYMASVLGYSNGATAYSNIATDYTGSSELIWKVVS